VRKESSLQKSIREYLELHDWMVLKYSATGAGETPGIPDLICFSKKKQYVFLELKRASGRKQVIQNAMHAHLKLFADVYVCTSVDELVEILKKYN